MCIYIFFQVTRNILELNLQNNEIREFGIEYLCREPENLRLKMLRLNGNKFGVEVISIEIYPDLKFLNRCE